MNEVGSHWMIIHLQKYPFVLSLACDEVCVQGGGDGGGWCACERARKPKRTHGIEFSRQKPLQVKVCQALQVSIFASHHFTAKHMANSDNIIHTNTSTHLTSWSLEGLWLWLPSSQPVVLAVRPMTWMISIQ